MSSIVLPCICIFFCYMKIFFFVHNSKRRISLNQIKTSNNEYSRSIILAKGLFTSFMIFTICWLPYGIIVMIDFEDRLPPSAHAFSMAFAHFNSTLNPIFYAMYNPGFKRGYNKLFSIIFCMETLSTARKSSTKSNLAGTKSSNV